MNESIRHILIALSLLGSGAAIASCGSQAPSEPELGLLAAELRGEGELAGAAALAGGEPDPASDCDCGPMVSRPPPECPRARWFCNAVGDCGCDQPSVGPGSETLAGVAERELSLQSSASERVGVAPAPSLGTSARAIRPSTAPIGDLPLTDGDPECKCLGATVSPPQGGCALVDWFCNASGLCRCRS